jgi:ribonuclease P protein component
MGVKPSGSLGLPRGRRIKQGRDFARVKAQGQRVVSGCLIANWLPLPEGSASRVGVVTGRKLGGAVVRNRARRLLRESFRVHQHQLRQPLDVVLVARASILGKPFCQVEADYLAALRRAGLLGMADGRMPRAE